MTTYHIPKNEQEMNELYVALSSDQNGEGIVSMITEMGGMPIVFGHPRMLEGMKTVLKQISKDTGKKILLVKYIKKEILEEIYYSH